MADPTLLQRPGQDDEPLLGLRLGRQRPRPHQQRRQQQGVLPARRRADVQHLHGEPIGLEKAIRIYYEAQTNILTSGADYGALGNALRQACTNMTGTNGIVAADCTQVNNAVLATEMDVEAAAPDTQIDSGPGQHRRPDPDLDVQRPGAVKPAQHRQAGGDVPVLGRLPARRAGAPCSGAGSHTPSLGPRRRQLHVPGPRQHRIEHRPDPGHPRLHGLDRRHGARLEGRQPGPGVRRRDPDLHDPRPATTAPAPPRTPRSSTSCRPERPTSRARSRARRRRPER